MDSRKKYIRISCMVVGIALVAFAALWFMGVIPWGHTAADVKVYGDMDESEEYVVYDGIKFPCDQYEMVMVAGNGLFLDTASGYRIQILHQYQTLDDFWGTKDEQIDAYLKDGFTFDIEPERYTSGSRDYIRYALRQQPGDEGLDYSEYNQIFLTPDYKGDRLFICINYNKDMDDMSETERSALFDNSTGWVHELMDSSEVTDEPDDATGKIIYSDSALGDGEDYTDSDTLTCAAGTVSFGLPHGYVKKGDPEADSAYYESYTEDTYIYISIKDYSMLLSGVGSLEEFVDSYAKNDHAMSQNCGSMDMDGKVFYYYSYFTQNWCDDGSVIVEYNFKAYCNIGDGQLYTISAHSFTNSGVMDPDNFIETMKLSIN